MANRLGHTAHGAPVTTICNATCRHMFGGSLGATVAGFPAAFFFFLLPPSFFFLRNSVARALSGRRPMRRLARRWWLNGNGGDYHSHQTGESRGQAPNWPTPRYATWSRVWGTGPGRQQSVQVIGCFFHLRWRACNAAIKDFVKLVPIVCFARWRNRVHLLPPKKVAPAETCAIDEGRHDVGNIFWDTFSHSWLFIFKKWWHFSCK